MAAAALAGFRPSRHYTHPTTIALQSLSEPPPQPSPTPGGWGGRLGSRCRCHRRRHRRRRRFENRVAPTRCRCGGRERRPVRTDFSRRTDVRSGRSVRNIRDRFEPVIFIFRFFFLENLPPFHPLSSVLSSTVIRRTGVLKFFFIVLVVRRVTAFDRRRLPGKIFMLITHIFVTRVHQGLVAFENFS